LIGKYILIDHLFFLKALHGDMVVVMGRAYELEHEHGNACIWRVNTCMDMWLHGCMGIGGWGHHGYWFRCMGSDPWVHCSSTSYVETS
jgi:hypothetical protein